MGWRSRVKWGLVIVVGGLVLIQLIPVWLFETNPATHAEPAWDTPRTRQLMQRACFDCHSNDTQWPWYSRVAPVSWLVTFDMWRGRRHLNLSEWTAPGGSRGEGADPARMARDIQAGAMPPNTYLLMHPDAKLTDAEKQALIDGILKTFK